MNYINVDDRSNNAGGLAGSCSACCCEPLSLRPGEIRLVTLNYAPWTVPIMANGGPGLVPGTEISITEDASACSGASIDGFAPPSVTDLYFNRINQVNSGEILEYDPADDTAPAGNAFEYRLVPVSGPSHGSLTASPLTGEWVYEPRAGFVGWDQYWIEITDAQGRKLVRPVNIRVGAPQGLPPAGWGPNAVIGLQVERSQVQVNQVLQTISFPIMLPPSNSCDTIDGCRRYRATIKAYARDCERLFSHITCIDVSCAKC